MSVQLGAITATLIPFDDFPTRLRRVEERLGAIETRLGAVEDGQQQEKSRVNAMYVKYTQPDSFWF